MAWINSFCRRYRKYDPLILKAGPQTVHLGAISTFHCDLSKATRVILIFCTMTCLGISLPSWISWLRRFVTIPSRSYTSSSRTPSPEESGSIDRKTSDLSGILPHPPAVYPPESKPAVDEYERWRPQTPPSAVYSPALSMLLILVLFMLFWAWYTNLSRSRIFRIRRHHTSRRFSTLLTVICDMQWFRTRICERWFIYLQYWSLAAEEIEGDCTRTWMVISSKEVWLWI